MLFEARQVTLASTFDHVDSQYWFSEKNVFDKDDEGLVWLAVRRAVEVDRHQGDVANYLYADGHVEAISTDVITEWCEEGTEISNFAQAVVR